MSRPPECAATFFKTWRSVLVGHLGLQSVTYRVDTPCSALGPPKVQEAYNIIDF